MLNLTKLETVEIPLHKLTLWEDNVRTSGAEDGLDELIASICSVGLLQSLVVKKASRGTFVIGAGKRRFLALSQLAEKGDVKRSYPVPCRIAPEDADLTEISLAENVVRSEMSVRQEVNAWRRLVDEGKSIGEIAVRFGVSETIVHRRLALARLSPALWTAYEAGEMTLEVLQAFTLTADHATQERVWNDLPQWDRDKPTAIRRILAHQDIPASDRTVRFVGLDQYKLLVAAVKRDLFSEGEDGTFICDAALLSNLAARNSKPSPPKPNKTAGSGSRSNPTSIIKPSASSAVFNPRQNPCRKRTAKIDKLEQKKAQLQEQAETDDKRRPGRPLRQNRAPQEQIEAIESQQTATFDAATKAQCGAIVTIGPDGEAPTGSTA